MGAPFIIFALPRSRTAWLAAFLSYGEWKCHHDLTVEKATVLELAHVLEKHHTGTAETGMVDGWKVVERLFPHARRVVVKRPLPEVSASLAKFGVECDEALMRRDALLDEVSRQPGVITVAFDDLEEESVCKRIFEHCLQEPFDREWWKAMKDTNIQIDMAKRITQLYNNRDKIAALKADAARLEVA